MPARESIFESTKSVVFEDEIPIIEDDDDDDDMSEDLSIISCTSS